MIVAGFRHSLYKKNEFLLKVFVKYLFLTTFHTCLFQKFKYPFHMKYSKGKIYKVHMPPGNLENLLEFHFCFYRAFETSEICL